MSARDNTPSLPAAIASMASRIAGDTWVMLPGRVESFDPVSLRCDVQPLVKRGVIDEDDERQVESLPVVVGCPVVYPPGYLADLQAGDQVMLVFASASLNVWLTRGGEVDPNDDRRGCLSDAVAVPQLRVPTASPIGFEPTHKATTYDAAFDILVAAIASAMAAITTGAPAGGTPAGAAITTALTAFQGARAAALTTIAKVK